MRLRNKLKKAKPFQAAANIWPLTFYLNSSGSNSHMKILVLQLARLGDILLTLPTMKALRKKYPEAEIHLMVRQKFSAAAELCSEVDRILTLDTQAALEPFLSEPLQVPEASDQIARWTESLREQNYDLIVNLTFSP